MALSEKEIDDLKQNLSTLVEKTSLEKQELGEKFETRLKEKNYLLEKSQLELNQCKSLIEQLKSRENTLAIEKDNLAKKVEFYKLSSAKQSAKNVEIDPGL